MSRFRFFIALTAALALTSCVSYPTLQQVARMRQSPDKKSTDLTADYKIADMDVVNYTDKVKQTLATKFHSDTGLRYGASSTQVTLAGLAGAAETLGWSVGTASGLGMASGYIFALGQTIDAKGKAQTYEQAFTAIQAAEATYYFHRLGMGFTKNEAGRTIVAPGDPNGRNDVPSSTNLTPDGETLYFRVSKVLKVLNDTLANKIPDLQDLKDATGESNGLAAPPATTGDAARTVTGFAILPPSDAARPKSGSLISSSLDKPTALLTIRREHQVGQVAKLPAGAAANILHAPATMDDARARQQLISLINNSDSAHLLTFEQNIETAINPPTPLGVVPPVVPPPLDIVTRRTKLTEAVNALIPGRAAVILKRPSMKDASAKTLLINVIKNAVDPGLKALEGQVTGT